MTTLAVTTVIGAVTDLLTEAYAGPPDPRSTWFIDNEPNAGVFGLLAGISAAEASTPVDARDEAGSTIAGNAEHLRWSLAAANTAFRGDPYPGNWAESWRTRTVDEAAWDQLRWDLRSEFDTAVRLLKPQTSLKDEYLLGVLALVPHAAFHLGLMRQMIDRVRQ